ncbi:2-hydroxyethylphosphonate methyltransferase [Halioglobus japonicus]|nr:2-hydroxyethylphosphonate methyltransferase [Halioglobus japonicus]
MARVAIIKLFTGLNLAPAQLSGELLRAGHPSKIIYLKNYEAHSAEEAKNYEVAEFSGRLFSVDGREVIWNCYKPFTETELELLISELREFKPDAVGFSLYSGIIKESALVTQKIREHFDVPIIWGGAAPTLEPELCIPHADILCINEGEEVIVELANRIDAGLPWDDIEGTWVKAADGTVLKHKNRPNIPLNDIAIPDWRRGSYVHIDSDVVKRGRFPVNLGKEYPIMTQRGCPFSCSFCIESRYQELFGKKDSLRRRDVDVVLEELRWAKQHLDIETILFYDDVFTVNPKWLKEFLPRYKEEIGLPFWCYTYPTTHDVELLKSLKAAGCISITMGVQSGSERILKDYYNRPTKMKRVIEAGREIVEAGLTGFFDLITINEFDREEDLRETFNFLLEFPKELKCLAFGEMISFPTYSYSVMSEKNQLAKQDPNQISVAVADEQPSRAVYDYYHRLYRLTRSDVPVETVRQIGEDRRYREDPTLIDSFLSRKKIRQFTGLSA